MDESQIIDELVKILELIEASGEPITPEEEQELLQIVQDIVGSVQAPTQREEEPPEEVEVPGGIPNAPTITDPATLLWILAGGNEDAFVNYLRTYPDPQLNTLLRNPQRLRDLLEELKQRQPIEDLTQEQADGVPHGPLQSSNIYGFRYDPKSGKLLVRFNSGSVYGYDGVPQGVFKVFAQGAVPAKTSGQNSFGKWWRGKLPSAGASFYEMIRKGGFPYQRIR